MKPTANIQPSLVVGTLLLAKTSLFAAAPFDASTFEQAATDTPVPAPYGYLVGARNAAGDLTGDGKPELVIGGVFGVHVLGNTSPAPGSSINPFTSVVYQPGSAQGVAIGDLDGDGRPDVLASQDGGFNVFPNVGTAGNLAIGPAQSFLFHQLYGPNMEVVVSDFDRDGAPDVAWSMGEGYQPGVVRNVSTPGNFSFSDFQILPGFNGDAFNTIVVGDVDVDGVPDLWAAAPNGGPFLLNRSVPGSLIFEPASAPPFAQFAVLADVDRDGRLDTVHRNQSFGALFVDTYTGDPGTPPTFFQFSFLAAPEVPSITDLKAADLDGDGRDDLVMLDSVGGDVFSATPPYVFHVWRSAGQAGNLTSDVYAERLTVDLANLWPTSCALADFDGDGRKDIAIAGYLLPENQFVVRTFFNRYPVQVDSEPPVISSVTADPPMIWPPNNMLVTVQVTVNATDESAFTTVIEGVTANQPIQAGDAVITGPLQLQLRASRAATLGDRVYAIVVRCTDTEGNSSTQTVNVTVPHDRRDNR